MSVHSLRAGGRGDARLARVALAIALAFALAGVAVLGKGLYIHAKAALAQVLIHVAWAERLAGTAAQPKPWPWADTHPVARLTMPRLGVDQIVLAGATGRTLAFGPAAVQGLGLAATTVLSGHRDTHFAFLRDLVPGDDLALQGADGVTQRYSVASGAIVHEGDVRLAESDAPTLVLATCWPFDAIDPGTPWRYLVTAVAKR
ncbi:MAG: class GN sortase [Rhodospirillales bacterium]|nr:class GN sortase [Rhodospirillales bacterium]